MHGLPVLRDFVATDQPQVRGLVLVGVGEHWGHIEESLNPDLDDIGRFYAAGRTVVAEIGDHVVGTGTLMPTSGSCAEIVRMSVAAAWRRRGVGRLIVEALIQTARE